MLKLQYFGHLIQSATHWKRPWCWESDENESDVSQSCPALCDPMNCSLPHSCVPGIFQARVLGRVGITFSRGSSQPRDWTWVFRIVGWRFTIWATREVHDAGKDWRQKKKRVAEVEIDRWYHWLSGPEFEQMLGDREAMGSHRVGHNLVTEQQQFIRDRSVVSFLMCFLCQILVFAL